MKKSIYLCMLSLLFITACNDNAPDTEDVVSGNYNVTVHYHHSWAVSMSNYGLVIDTNYTTTFKIEKITDDTINVRFGGFDGTEAYYKLCRPYGSSGDTLFYMTPYYDYNGGYSGAKLDFYKSTGKLYFYAPQKTNPSGGGLNKFYDIKSL